MRFLTLVSPPLVAVLVLVAACGGSSSSEVPDVGDSGTDSGASSDATDGATPFPCAPADLSSVPEILPVFKSGDPPTATGGTLVPGRYVMTSMTFYFGTATVPPPPTTKYRDVLEISGDEQRSTSIDSKTDGGAGYTVGAFTVSNSTKTTTFRCASAAAFVGKSAAVPFTATGTTITTFTAGTPSIVQELTRQ